jgi:hypothetical protein
MTIEKQKIYHCSTKNNAVFFLQLCEEQGICWRDNRNATYHDIWNEHQVDTCYYVHEDGKMTYGSKDFFNEEYPHLEMISIKATQIKKERKAIDLAWKQMVGIA